MLPDHVIQTFFPNDHLPGEAENLFAKQLAESRRHLDGSWTFVLICAVTPDGHVLGGVHLAHYTGQIFIRTKRPQLGRMAQEYSLSTELALALGFSAESSVDTTAA